MGAHYIYDLGFITAPIVLNRHVLNPPNQISIYKLHVVAISTEYIGSYFRFLALYLRQLAFGTFSRIRVVTLQSKGLGT